MFVRDQQSGIEIIKEIIKQIINYLASANIIQVDKYK